MFLKRIMVYAKQITLSEAYDIRAEGQGGLK